MLKDFRGSLRMCQGLSMPLEDLGVFFKAFRGSKERIWPYLRCQESRNKVYEAVRPSRVISLLQDVPAMKLQQVHLVHTHQRRS